VELPHALSAMSETKATEVKVIRVMIFSEFVVHPSRIERVDRYRTADQLGRCCLVAFRFAQNGRSAGQCRCDGRDVNTSRLERHTLIRNDRS
jgi:hypothetical protein